MAKLEQGLRIFLLFLLVAVISSCATVSPNPRIPHTNNIKDYVKTGYKYFRANKYRLAQRTFSAGLKHDPTNCRLNFLKALSYHMMGKDDDVKNLELAGVGYKIAMNYCPRDPWPRYYYALIAMQQKNYALAAKLLEQAAKLSHKHETTFLKAGIISAYGSGNIALTQHLLARYNKLKPNDRFTSDMRRLIPKNIDTHNHSYNKFRRNNKRTHGFSPTYTNNHKEKQAVVDAIIIVNNDLFSATRGINLFDGLKLQYSGKYQSKISAIGNWRKIQEEIPNSSFEEVPIPSLITNAISIPEVNYSLNIFNDTHSKSQILARPTLLAQDGKTATFFSGTKLLIGIRGENTSDVKEFPVGLIMKLKPTFQKDGSINIHITVGRDILIPSPTLQTTFSELGAELAEDVSTTINLDFGETAILSALSEHSLTSKQNGTPLIGRIPIIRNLFNERHRELNYTSVLILLTIEHYKSFHSPMETKKEHRQLSEYYTKFVDPGTNIGKVISHLRKSELYHQFHEQHVGTVGTTDIVRAAAQEEAHQAIEEF